MQQGKVGGLKQYNFDEIVGVKEYYTACDGTINDGPEGGLPPVDRTQAVTRRREPESKYVRAER